MLNLILFVLATIGLTTIVLESSLFLPVRTFLEKILPAKVYEVFKCNQCMGTWCGFFCGWALISHSPIIIICCGFAGSYVAVLGSVIVDYLGAKAYSALDKR